MKKVLVPIDGSDNSKRALIEAKNYAQCIDGEITILTVIETLGRYTTVGYQLLPIDNKMKDLSQSLLENALELMDDFKGKKVSKLRKGNPADEIITEAEDGDYDLIIMGSRGLGTFSRTILGSVSNKVLNHTEKNVFIVR